MRKKDGHNRRKTLLCPKLIGYNFVMKQKLDLPTVPIVSIQQSLRPVLPVILGCKTYKNQEELIQRMERLLTKSGIEAVFVRLSLERYEAEVLEAGKKVEEWQRVNFSKKSIQALRCTILRNLLGESLRGMCQRLAECPLYQIFCKLDDFERVHVPSKSTLQTYEHWLKKEEMVQIIAQLTEAVSDEEEAQKIGLEKAINMEMITVDTTCLEANIHFPVDWILLRDVVRGLMRTTLTIRKHGLKHRMLDPMEFLSRMNKHCIAMSGARRKADSKRQRKAILREMKVLIEIVKNHALRHHTLLNQEWKQTELSRKQAEIILKRIDLIMEQIPAAKKQAHERIIGERKVPSAGKILSLNDSDLHIIKKGKAGAHVEIGNILCISKQELGYIIDYELLKDASPGDATLLLKRYSEIEKVTKNRIKVLSADRGFDTQATRALLEEKGVYNVLCPKDPKELARRLKEEPEFKKILKQRGSIEGRISILKNVFLWGTPKAKGYENRSMQVVWAVLSHNLWILVRRGSWKEDAITPLAA